MPTGEFLFCLLCCCLSAVACFVSFFHSQPHFVGRAHTAAGDCALWGCGMCVKQLHVVGWNFDWAGGAVSAWSSARAWALLAASPLPERPARRCAAALLCTV